MNPTVITRPGPTEEEWPEEHRRVLLVAGHPDHRAVGQATVDAIYPTARDPLQFPEQTQEGLEPHKVKEIFIFGTEQPNVLLDIEDTIEDKIEALKMHVSQVGTAEELGERV